MRHESLGHTSLTAAKVNVTCHVSLNVYGAKYDVAPCHFRHILRSARAVLQSIPTLPNPRALMCSYTRDPHLGPKGRPLPSPMYLSQETQLHAHSCSYTSDPAVTLAVLHALGAFCPHPSSKLGR
jgi:hypothetical protein